MEYDQHIYLYNVGAQKFLVVGVTGGTQATTLQDQPQPVSISDDGNGNFNFITTEGLRNYMCAAPQMDYPISVWSSDDAGAQWEITESTVPADYETCIALLKARMGMENEDYELVFSDEFNGEGEPNADYWVRTPRASSTWNRWCSNDSRVVYEQGGTLHCLAIPTPDDSDDTAPMLTGGIKSQGMFTFQYGRAVARIKTNQWRGNFPAFWMMPADNSAGWPNAGEIDIWETIDTSTQSWHTVHTNWTYNLHQGTNSQNYNNIDYNLWHTYAVDWDSQAITWYVDGNKVWSYTKSTDTNALDNGQWPFDAPFYLILNQSVGNGSWAANADTNHTYETLFDWVRVYQPKDATAIQGQESRA
ncbi:MAG: glycoside hydrolase family 16 protein, partial [Bacteroidales bacterium]|nr:glycoside hydrolase family 16 protein [Bacteroidales bacterium]